MVLPTTRLALTSVFFGFLKGPSRFKTKNAYSLFLILPVSLPPPSFYNVTNEELNVRWEVIPAHPSKPLPHPLPTVPSSQTMCGEQFYTATITFLLSLTFGLLFSCATHYIPRCADADTDADADPDPTFRAQLENAILLKCWLSPIAAQKCVSVPTSTTAHVMFPSC